jgi:very-short-patch-repair endonuclease
MHSSDIGFDVIANLRRAADYYAIASPEILSAPKNQWATDPYAFEHAGGIRLTPIEEALWFDIRLLGAVFYPQYPVGKYFVDFANPVARVAIECDGRDFHLDKAKDLARQRELESMGWAIYRISGSDCKTVDKYDDNGNTISFSLANIFLIRIIIGHELGADWKIASLARSLDRLGGHE